MTLQIALSIVGAFVAAAAGALAALWYQRGRPWVGLKSIRRDDRDMVDIPAELRALADGQRWASEAFAEKVPLYKLIKYAGRVDDAIVTCKGTLDKVHNLHSRLQSGIQGLKDQKGFIEEILSDVFLPQVLTAMNLQGSLPLPESIEESEGAAVVVQIDDLTASETPEKALIVYGEQRRYSLRAGTGLVGPQTIRRTKVLGRVFQFFIQAHLVAIIGAVKEELQRDYHSLLEIRERLSGVIRSRRLVLRAQVANTGGVPIHLEPFTLLKIKSSGKPVSPVVAVVEGYRVFEPGFEDLDRMVGLVEGVAEKQGVQTGKTPQGFEEGPEFVVVSGGQLVEVELATITPIDDDAVVHALEAGMLSCQLVMKRVAQRWRPWLRSKELIMGLNLSQAKKDELLAQA